MRMKVDMGMMSKLLRTIYRNHPVTVGVREATQNGKDACIKAGVKPRISVKIQNDSTGTWVTVTDNGCGMNLDTIENAFLSIGNPHKELETGATGRFGIGIKVAINSQSQWYVKTNEYEFDNTFLLDDDMPPAISKNPIKGTEIGMYCTERLYDEVLGRALEMLYFSDLSVDLTVEVGGKIVLHEITNPYRPAKVEKHTDKYDVYIAPLSKLYKSEGPRNIFRINGLVQFVTEGNRDRKTNLIFDFKSTPYPLTPSRESLKGELEYEVNRLIQKHDVDSLTSLRQLTKPEETTISKSGFNLQGRRGLPAKEEQDPVGEYIERYGVRVSSFGHRNRDGSEQVIHISDGASAFVPVSLIATADSEELVRKVLELAQVAVPEPPAKPTHPSLLFKNFKASSTRQRVAATNALKVWIELLPMVADPDDVFGAGLSGEDLEENAERCYDNGNYFYLLNPGFLSSVLTKEGKVLALWTLACHEVTHHVCETHNERFSSRMGAIEAETADEVFRNLKDLKKLL